MCRVIYVLRRSERSPFGTHSQHSCRIPTAGQRLEEPVADTLGDPMKNPRINGNSSRRRRPQAGFSMVEVMMALGVLLVAVMGAFSSQAASSNLIRISRETDLALADLQACMEQALTLGTDDLPIAGSLFEDGQPVALYEDLNLEGESIVTTYPDYVVGQAIPDPLEIVLTLTWSDYGTRSRTVTLNSVKVR
ncbi:MAG TPA: prepilin-type N-terminal cleavage/methylation domain-containing protein [Planctomycetes bacterium]|nr:prepilin-type N-terminal cleavage/methylation domain-containing protein [Planctomycetota bacterium]HIK60407.1 prepilin-type N-terminal cleavage/methylation domain-containing protein [Planctomycetota bacterium]